MDESRLNSILQKIIDNAAIDSILALSDDPPEVKEKHAEVLRTFIKHGVPLKTAVKIMSDLADIFLEQHDE